MIEQTLYICEKCNKRFESEAECLKHEKENHKKRDKTLRVMYCYGDVWIDEKGELCRNYSETDTEDSVLEDDEITTDSGETFPARTLNHPEVSVSDAGLGDELRLEGFFNADNLDDMAEIFDRAAYERAKVLAEKMTALKEKLSEKLIKWNENEDNVQVRLLRF